MALVVVFRADLEEQTYGCGKEGEVGGEMYGESNTETYITRCQMESPWQLAI